MSSKKQFEENFGTTFSSDFYICLHNPNLPKNDDRRSVDYWNSRYKTNKAKTESELHQFIADFKSTKKSRRIKKYTEAIANLEELKEIMDNPLSNASCIGIDNGYRAYKIENEYQAVRYGLVEGGIPAHWCISGWYGYQNKESILLSAKYYLDDYISRDISFYFFISAYDKYALCIYKENLFIEREYADILANFEVFNLEDNEVGDIPEKLEFPYYLTKEELTLDFMLKDGYIDDGNFIYKENKLCYIHNFNMYIPDHITSISSDMNMLQESAITVEFKDGIYYPKKDNPYFLLVNYKNIKRKKKFYLHKDTKCILPFLPIRDLYYMGNEIELLGVKGQIYSSNKMHIYYLDNTVFKEVSTIKELILPNGMESISSFLSYYKNLSEITIPKSITHMECNAFSRLKAIVYYIGRKEDWLSITFDNKYANPLSMHDPIIYFLDGDSKEDFIIPDGIKEIKENSCLGFLKLHTIYIPKSVEVFHPYAFYGKGMYTVIYEGSFSDFLKIRMLTGNDPSDLNEETDSSFIRKECKEFYVDNGMTKIHFDEITELHIPYGVDTLYSAIFSSFKKASSLYLPSTIKKIEEDLTDEQRTIYYMGSDRVWFLADIGRINYSTVYLYKDFSYYSPKELYIPMGIEEIKENSLIVFPNLNKLHIPSSVKKIECELYDPLDAVYYEYTFEEFLEVDLNSSTIAESKHSYYLYNGKYIDYSLIKKYEIPESITRIKSYSLNGLTNLEELIIPASITQMDCSFHIYGKKLDVYYKGTLKEYLSIRFSSGSNPAILAKRFYLYNENKEFTLVEDVHIPLDIKALTSYSLWNIRNLYIPHNLTSFEWFSFHRDTKDVNHIERLYYDGTIHDFLKLSFGESIDPIAVQEIWLKNENNVYDLCDTITLDHTFSKVVKNSLFSVKNLILKKDFKYFSKLECDNCIRIEHVYFDGTFKDYIEANTGGLFFYAHVGKFYLRNEDGVYYSPLELEVPKEITKVEDWSCAHIPNVEVLYIHRNIEKIGFKAFSTNSLRKIYFDGSADLLMEVCGFHDEYIVSPFGDAKIYVRNEDNDYIEIELNKPGFGEDFDIL